MTPFHTRLSEEISMTVTFPARARLAPAPTPTWTELLRRVLRPVPMQTQATAQTRGRRRARPSIAPLEWG